ncbi:MAG: hypothetical protein U0457_04870 [Candidatus Sericytochromatia bacterium]
MKLVVFLFCWILLITNSFAIDLKKGDLVEPEDIAKSYQPKLKKGMKWLYLMKAPVISFELATEITNIKDDNVTIKYTARNKIKEKTIKLKEFSFIPKVKKDNKEYTMLANKIKYEGNENISISGKNYNTQKFSGDAETPAGKAKTLIWFAKDAGIIKMESKYSMLGLPVTGVFELKDFINP